jgi:hypothetical protein
MLHQSLPDQSLITKMRSWTPAYILRRLYHEVYMRTHPDEPWFARPAIHFVREWIKPDDRGFEWGSGRSTLWFAHHSRFIASVEHHEGWYQQVRADIDANKLTNVDYHFCDLSKESDETAAQSDYVQIITRYDEPFDYIVVDGRVRDHCAMLAIRHLNTGGLLIVDNANRFIVPPRWVRVPYYVARDEPLTPVWTRFIQETASWRQIWMNDGVNCTLLLLKPAEG